MNKQWNTRQTLLRRAKNTDDAKAWEEFIFYYRDFLSIIIYKIRGFKDHFSEDLLQTALLEVWRSLPKFDPSGEAKFRTWLSRVVRYTVIDELKKETKFSEKSNALDAIPQLAESELEELIRREWEMHITRLALNNISKRFTGKAIKVFEMSLTGAKIEQICEELELTTDSAYTLKNRVKKYLILEIKRLREELES